MSYKTNPLGLRLKQTIGWKFSSFFIKNYTINVVLWLKIYLLLRAYLIMRNYKLLSCELRINEKFTKTIYINVLKIKKKRKKIYIKKNRLEKRRHSAIILGLYNQYYKFFKQNNLESKTWLKNWSYLKYPVNTLNPWTSVWWMQYIAFFFQNKQKDFKKILSQFVQVQKLMRCKHSVTTNFLNKNLLTKQVAIRKKKYYFFFLNTKLKNLLLQKKKLVYTYTLTNKIFKILANISWKYRKYTPTLKLDLSPVTYLEFNRRKLKAIKTQVYHLRKKITYLKNIIEARQPVKYTKLWKYKNLKSLSKIKQNIKIVTHQQKLLIRAAIYNKLPTIWFLKLSERFTHKKNYFTSNINHLIFLRKVLKKWYRVKNLHKPQKNNASRELRLKRYKALKIITKKSVRSDKQKVKMSRKKKIKSGYKYKKKTKKASLTTNSIPNVTKKQRYVSYVKQHKPALAHALIKKKNAKYIVYKKMLQPSYLYKRKQLITLSEQKKMNEKKFQVNNFINVANFKLLSRLQLKYNIEDWIKQYFNINATLHVSLPLRHYKNLNWYNLTKKFFTQDLKKTIKKKNIQSTHVEIYRYPLLNRNNTGYLRKKIIKKKNSVYLIMSDLSLKEMNTQDKLFYRQKWYMKTILNRFLPLFSLFSTYYEPQLLTDQIAKELELTKSHRFLYRNLESVLDILKTRCTFNFKVEICGRFNSSVRSKKIYISRGSVITNSFHQRISYAFAQSYARIGCFGVKVWINF